MVQASQNQYNMFPGRHGKVMRQNITIIFMLQVAAMGLDTGPHIRTWSIIIPLPIMAWESVGILVLRPA